MNAFFKHLIGLGWPAMFTALLGYLLLNEMVDFGGGEKDLVLIIPAMAFTFLYTISYSYLSFVKKTTWGRAALYSTLVSIAILFIIALIMPDRIGIQW